MMWRSFIAFLFLAAPVWAQQSAPSDTLIRNVRVFDGRSDRLSGNTDVLVRGNEIAAIRPGQ